jgi:hypothetical protein
MTILAVSPSFHPRPPSGAGRTGDGLGRGRPSHIAMERGLQSARPQAFLSKILFGSAALTFLPRPPSGAGRTGDGLGRGRPSHMTTARALDS